MSALLTPVRLFDLAGCTGYPMWEESVKNKKKSKSKDFFLFSLSDHVSGRAKRHSLDLLFRFASRQNEKQASLMRVSKKEKSIYYRQFKY